MDLEMGNDSIEYNAFKGKMNVEIMEMIYLRVMEDLDSALKSNTPIESRISALNVILKHFEDREEYEKCLNLKKIIEKLEC